MFERLLEDLGFQRRIAHRHGLYASHLLSGRPCPAGSGAISLAQPGVPSQDFALARPSLRPRPVCICWSRAVCSAGRTRVVGAFPDGQSALNLAAARLRHIAGTAWSTKRYLNIELLKDQMKGAVTA